MVKQIRVSHILVNNETHCKELFDKLKQGASFEELAKQFSKCPSGKRSGGDLGFFGKGQMVPQFENAAFKLNVNELCMCKTQFGYHIIKKTAEK